jgi:hypothetical protein
VVADVVPLKIAAEKVRFTESVSKLTAYSELLFPCTPWAIEQYPLRVLAFRIREPL